MKTPPLAFSTGLLPESTFGIVGDGLAEDVGDIEIAGDGAVDGSQFCTHLKGPPFQNKQMSSP